MESPIVSNKYPILMPRSVVKGLQIEPGEKLVVMEKGRHIYLVPVGAISKGRGIARGATWEGIREKSDRP